MRKLATALLAAALVVTLAAPASAGRGGGFHYRKHRLPVRECIDLGFNEDGTPIIICA